MNNKQMMKMFTEYITWNNATQTLTVFGTVVRLCKNNRIMYLELNDSFLKMSYHLNLSDYIYNDKSDKFIIMNEFCNLLSQSELVYSFNNDSTLPIEMSQMFDFMCLVKSKSEMNKNGMRQSHINFIIQCNEALSCTETLKFCVHDDIDLYCNDFDVNDVISFIRKVYLTI